MTKNLTKEYLETAIKLITGPRANDYGDKVINHGNIGKLWSAYLGVPITAHDVAICMTLLKIARAKFGNPTPDTYVDGSAYAASYMYTSIHTESFKHVAYTRDSSGNHSMHVNGGIASGVGNASAVSPNSGNGYYDKSTAGTNQDDMDYTGGSAKEPEDKEPRCCRTCRSL